MAERSCVYTALFGQYEDLLEQSIAADSTVDFICFTDNPDLRSETWKIRVIDRAIPADPARSSRYPKICPHRFLEDYELSMYIDNSVLLLTPPEEAIPKLLMENDDLAAIAHSFRESVLDEFQAVIDQNYDAQWVCEEQLDHYRELYPHVLTMQPLIGGILVRRHMRPNVIRAMELWWFNVLRYSRRDQLSFRIALWESSLAPRIWDLDVRDNEFWRWPASVGRERSGGAVLASALASTVNRSRPTDETAPTAQFEC